LKPKPDLELPITREVHAILFEGKNVMFALADLMTRDPKPE
jgi:glycerol-3-phosphate dehydrogenase